MPKNKLSTLAWIREGYDSEVDYEKAQMKKEYAKLVINFVKENPGIHYDALSYVFPDGNDEGRLYRLLYGLKYGVNEGSIISGEDTMIPPAGKRGLERNVFWINEDNYTEDKLNETFSFWKL